MDQLFEFLGHHPVLFSALGAVLVLLIVNELTAAMLGDRRLSPLEAVRLINDQNALILDVRPHGDYKRGHILNGAQRAEPN